MARRAMGRARLRSCPVCNRRQLTAANLPGDIARRDRNADAASGGSSEQALRR